MELFLLLLSVVLFIWIGAFIRGISLKKELKLEIKDSFGGYPRKRYKKDFSVEDINQFFNYDKNIGRVKREVDRLTWNDLGMDEVYKRINYSSTPFGEAYLYNRLTNVKRDEEFLNNIEKIMEGLEEDSEAREKLRFELEVLGQKKDKEFFNLIFKPEDRRVENYELYYFLSLAFIVSIIITIVNPIGFLLLIIFFVINSMVYNSAKDKMENGFQNINYLIHSINQGKKIGKLSIISGESFIKELNDCINKFKGIRISGGKGLSYGYNDADMLGDFVKGVFMWDIITYQRSINKIIKNKKEFIRLFYLLGEIDFLVSTVYLRKSLPYYCNQEFHKKEEIVIEGLYHILIKEPIVNNIDIKKNIIITGSNASGKSTFIKALGINALLSQGLNTSTSEYYIGDFYHTISSMAIKDDLLSGESYFIAEINSLKRLMESGEGETRVLGLVDEILKGTNTVERIAASTSILKWMVKKNIRLIVASHDIELTELLKEDYVNYHFREEVLENGIIFDYKIHKGPSRTRNAIKLLDYLGYEKSVVEDAEKLSLYFMENRRWK